MYCKENIEILSEKFKALSHPIRLQIAMGLMKKENCNVTKMVEKLGMAQPKISQHLTILKSAGIIDGYRKGNQICYKLTCETTRKILKATLRGEK